MAAKLSQSFIEEMRARIEEARKTIDVTKTVKALQQCLNGDIELSKEQIRAAEILLKKSMPDLKEIEHKMDANTDLAEFLAKGRERAANRNKQH